MGTSRSFEELSVKLNGLASDLGHIRENSVRTIVARGSQEMLEMATARWGSDRRFSHARHSKGRRRAGVGKGVAGTGEATTGRIYASGDPWYIFERGRRGGLLISPMGANKRRVAYYRRKDKVKGTTTGLARALTTPRGPRARIHQGRMAPRPVWSVGIKVVIVQAAGILAREGTMALEKRFG